MQHLCSQLLVCRGRNSLLTSGRFSLEISRVCIGIIIGIVREIIVSVIVVGLVICIKLPLIVSICISENLR
jgi:hypothetical protein